MNLLAFREPVNAWSHCSWLLLSLPGTWLLVWKSRGDLGKQLSLLIFGVSLGVCYAGSTLFHGVRLSAEDLALFNLIDYIGIYILIAGSYTPLAWNMLRGSWRWWTLGLAWGMAAVFVSIQITCGMLSQSVATMTYLVMGWGAIFCYIEMSRRHSQRKLRLILIGGAFYTIGAAINSAAWSPFPAILGRHETFHFLVMAGSLSHFWFMLTIVVPEAHVPATARAVAASRPARVAFSKSLAS